MTPVHPLLVMRHRKEADQLAAMIAAEVSVYAAPAYTVGIEDEVRVEFLSWKGR